MLFSRKNGFKINKNNLKQTKRQKYAKKAYLDYALKIVSKEPRGAPILKKCSKNAGASLTCDTPGSSRVTSATGPFRGGCSATLLLRLKNARTLRKSAATRVARQGVPAHVCNYAAGRYFSNFFFGLIVDPPPPPGTNASTAKKNKFIGSGLGLLGCFLLVSQGC